MRKMALNEQNTTAIPGSAPTKPKAARNADLDKLRYSLTEALD